MRSRIFSMFKIRSHGPWILASALLVALLVAPFAGAFGEGNAVRGGARNPSPDARRAYSKETQIIANVSTYGTRQSNKSNNGGGAVYGCRSGAGGTPKGNEPCIRANNLSTGLAFEFNSTNPAATQVGTINATNANAAPFTTNAHGVASGLNADRVDGKNADDIVADAQASNNFATVTGTTGALGTNRGATSSSRTGTGTYSVVFSGDISKCSRTATVATSDGTPATTTTDLTGTSTVVVRTFAWGGTTPALALADASFDLTVTC